MTDVHSSSLVLVEHGYNTGGGEEIEGYETENGGPPTLCQPASQQGGGEEVNNLAGGAWRGLEECWGLWEKFWFLFHT